MITKSNIDPSNFRFNSASCLNEILFNTYTSHIPTDLFTLSNKNGLEVCITNFGARIVSMIVPDMFGKFRDVVLGFDTLKGYLDYPQRQKNFYGACIGRYANRIKDCTFSLNGEKFYLPDNENGNCLHGGPFSWAYQTFEVLEYNAEKALLKLRLFSPDGDMGFPGLIEFHVTFCLKDDNSFHINYEAMSDKPTVLNPTNHIYFNLEGNPSHTILNDRLFVSAKYITEIDYEGCPTGRILKIRRESPFNFFSNSFFKANYLRRGKRIGDGIHDDNIQIDLGNGYDHNYVILSLNDARLNGVRPYKGSVPMCAKLHNDISGITMYMYSTEPGLQLYDSADSKYKYVGKNNIAYGPYSGVCLEAQHFANSPNINSFPSTVLYPNQMFRSTTIYKFC